MHGKASGAGADGEGQGIRQGSRTGWGRRRLYDKPFSVLELLARVRSLLRRTKEEEPEQPKLFDCGALHLDLETREVKVNGREVLLTYKEYELLVYLAENQNRVVSRDELLDKLWDWRADVETRTLDIHIKTLRQKLGEEAGHYIKTVRSVGYRFMKPQE